MSPKSACPTIDQLFRYLNRSSKETSDLKLEQHIKKCSHCRFLTETPLPKMPEKLAGTTDKIDDALSLNKPDQTTFGQIWRVRGIFETELAIITFDTRHSRDEYNPDVRIVTLNLKAASRDMTPKDLLFSENDSSLGLRFLVETWNERPIMVFQLEKYLGEITASAARNLREAIKPTPSHGDETEIPRWIERFRQRRIDEAHSLSVHYISAMQGFPVVVPEDVSLPEKTGKKPISISISISIPKASRNGITANEELRLAAAEPAKTDPFDGFKDKLKRLISKKSRLAVFRTLDNDDFLLVFPEECKELLVCFLHEKTEVIRLLTSNRRLFFKARPEGFSFPEFTSLKIVPL